MFHNVGNASKILFSFGRFLGPLRKHPLSPADQEVEWRVDEPRWAGQSSTSKIGVEQGISRNS